MPREAAGILSAQFVKLIDECKILRGVHNYFLSNISRACLCKEKDTHFEE